MRGKTISKIIFVLIIGVVLLTMPAHVFATSGAADLNEFWEDQTTDLEPETPTTPENPTTPEPTTPTTPEPTTPSTPTTEKEEKLPEAGLAEDTMMVVAVIALGTIAIFANKKVKEYNNI